MTWNDPVFRAQLLKNPLATMKESLDYDCPFDLYMSARADGDGDESGKDKFAPIYTGGWIGDGDLIRLNLPPAPEDPRHRAEALAAFNQDHIFFLPHKSRKPRK